MKYYVVGLPDEQYQVHKLKAGFAGLSIEDYLKRREAESVDRSVQDIPGVVVVLIDQATAEGMIAVVETLKEWTQPPQLSFPYGPYGDLSDQYEAPSQPSNQEGFRYERRTDFEGPDMFSIDVHGDLL